MKKELKGTLGYPRVVLSPDCLKTMDTCSQAIEIFYLIRKAIVRSYSYKFFGNNKEKEIQEEILESLKILDNCPAEKTIKYEEIVMNLKLLGMLIATRYENGWFNSVLAGVKIVFLRNKTYQLSDLISGLKVDYPEAVKYAIAEMRYKVEKLDF